MKKLVLLFSVFALLSLLGCPPVDDPENGGGGTDVVVEKLPTPYITLAEGSKLIKGAKLEFHCEVEGVKFYYTVDGTDPTLASASANFYEVQISKGTLLINLIATKDGYENSDVYKGTFEVVDEKAPKSFSFEKDTVYVQKGESAALKLNVSPVGTEELIKIEVKKNDTETVNTITYDYSTVSTTNAAAAGAYTITASYDGLESQKATIYVWEYKEVTPPTTKLGTQGQTVNKETDLNAGNSWLFNHSEGRAKDNSKQLRVYVDRSGALDGYIDYTGAPLDENTYGFFVDWIGGATFSASLLKKETLAAGLYSLEAQYAGNAGLVTGDSLELRIGDESIYITEFTDGINWTKSLLHETGFYRVETQSEVEYGFSLSTVAGSGVWGFVHSFKLRYIPEN